MNSFWDEEADGDVDEAFLLITIKVTDATECVPP